MKALNRSEHKFFTYYTKMSSTAEKAIPHGRLLVILGYRALKKKAI